MAASFRRAQLFPSDHPNFAGDLGIGPNPKLAARIKEADLLLLVGGRLSETPSYAYTLIDLPVPSQKLVHVHPGAEELGRVYQPALAIQASPIAFAARLAALDVGTRGNAEDAATAHADYLAWSDNPRKLPGRFQYGEVMCWLRERLPPDAIVCNGAGNFAGWIHRYFRFRQYGEQLAPTSGSMGYGVPAAVIAKRQHPNKIVVAFAGDGDFQMNGQEIGTAVQFDIPFVDHRHRQRHVRHHPHASGEQLSEPRLVDRPEEPGFRRTRPRLWRPRRAGRDHGGVSNPPSNARWPRASPRSCTACSIRRPSPPRARSTSCARPRRRGRRSRPLMRHARA